jgi:maltoporin
MKNNFDCQYDGILGQDFWKDKWATIYCDRKTTMGEVTKNFDDETNKAVREFNKQTLNSRIENIVHFLLNPRDMEYYHREK